MANKFLRALLGGLAGGAQGVSQEYLRQQDLGEQRKREAVEQLRIQRGEERMGRLDKENSELRQRGADMDTYRLTMDMDPEAPLTSEAAAALGRIGVAPRKGSRAVEDATVEPILKGQPVPESADNFMRGLMGGAKPTIADGRATSTTLPYTAVGMRSEDTNLRPLNAQERLREQTLQQLRTFIDDPRTNELDRARYEDAYLAQGGTKIPPRPKPRTLVVPDDASETGFSEVSSLDGQEVSRTPASAPAGYRKKSPSVLSADQMLAARALGLDPDKQGTWTAGDNERVFNKTNPPPKATGGSGGQSTPPGPRGKMPEPYVIAVNRAMGMARIPVATAENLRSTAQMLWDSGDKEGLNSFVRQMAFEGEPVDIKNRATARIETADALKNAARIMVDLRKRGVDTNLLEGSAERLKQWLGTSGSPELATLGTQLEATLMNYRRSITGAAFSESEAKAYKSIWPNISSDFSLNSSRIQGMINILQDADKAYWQRKLGVAGADMVGATPKLEVGGAGGGGQVTLVAPNGDETMVSEAEAKRIMAADPLVKRKGK